MNFTLSGGTMSLPKKASHSSTRLASQGDILLGLKTTFLRLNFMHRDDAQQLSAYWLLICTQAQGENPPTNER